MSANDAILIEGVSLTETAIFEQPRGDVFHGVRQTDQNINTIAEAYFSFVNTGKIKGWKRHKIITLNLLVPIGEIAFCLYDDRRSSATFGAKQTFCLSRDNYKRLTVPPLIWVAFKGLNENCNMLVNFADVIHDPTESESIEVERIDFIL